MTLGLWARVGFISWVDEVAMCLGKRNNQGTKKWKGPASWLCGFGEATAWAHSSLYVDSGYLKLWGNLRFDSCTWYRRESHPPVKTPVYYW